MRTLLRWLSAVVLGGLVYTLGVAVGGALTRALGLALPETPAATNPSLALASLFVSGAVCAVGIGAMAVGMSGGTARRWASLALFLVLARDVNTALESSIFTNFGGTAATALAFFPSSILLAAVVAVLLRPPASVDGHRLSAASGTAFAMLARYALAILAFPAAYLVFGMLISPLVIPVYESLDFLVVPPMSTILPMQLLRSSLFLVASLPVLRLWGGTRWRLFLALGWAMALVVGLSGLIVPSFLPASLRAIHSVEITADSFAYAGALVLLLTGRQRRPAVGADAAPAG